MTKSLPFILAVPTAALGKGMKDTGCVCPATPHTDVTIRNITIL